MTADASVSRAVFGTVERDIASHMVGLKTDDGSIERCVARGRDDKEPRVASALTRAPRPPPTARQ